MSVSNLQMNDQFFSDASSPIKRTTKMKYTDDDISSYFDLSRWIYRASSSHSVMYFPQFITHDAYFHSVQRLARSFDGRADSMKDWHRILLCIEVI